MRLFQSACQVCISYLPEDVLLHSAEERKKLLGSGSRAVIRGDSQQVVVRFISLAVAGTGGTAAPEALLDLEDLHIPVLAW